MLLSLFFWHNNNYASNTASTANPAELGETSKGNIMFYAIREQQITSTITERQLLKFFTKEDRALYIKTHRGDAVTIKTKKASKFSTCALKAVPRVARLLISYSLYIPSINHFNLKEKLIMKQTIDLYAFREAFYNMGRKDSFSYGGLEILFDCLEGLEQATGEEMELDVISLRGEFTESTIDDLISEYDIDISDCDTDDEEAIKETVIEYMEQNTIVCGVTSNGSVVYEAF